MIGEVILDIRDNLHDHKPTQGAKVSPYRENERTLNVGLESRDLRLKELANIIATT